MHNAPASLRFLGHATVLIELAGLRILTDPVLTDRVAFIRRTSPSPEPDHQQAIDVVLVSHGHLDHLHRASLELVGRDVVIIVPHGMGAMVRRWGFRHVLVADPHERFELGSLTVTATPAVHSGDRPPSGPRGTALGYLIEAADRRIYFAGDTDLFDGMAAIGQPGLDVALLPVWGWGPRLGPGHLDPERAARAAGLLDAKVTVPIHWGSLWPMGMRWRRNLLADPPHRLAAEARRLGLATRVAIVAPGERLEV
jgi:L-ascorbate metabolism protein UlaG (beta-lactamase superfamily)